MQMNTSAAAAGDTLALVEVIPKIIVDNQSRAFRRETQLSWNDFTLLLFQVCLYINCPACAIMLIPPRDPTLFANTICIAAPRCNLPCSVGRSENILIVVVTERLFLFRRNQQGWVYRVCSMMV